jgi:hypothetical protein
METSDQRSNCAHIVTTEEEPEQSGASVPISRGGAASLDVAEGDDDVHAMEVPQMEPIHLTSIPTAKRSKSIGNKAAHKELRAHAQCYHGIKIREKHVSDMANVHF